MWVASWQGGVVYFKDGKVRATYGPGDGLGTGRVNDLYLDHETALWVATEGGLSRIEDGRVSTLTAKGGLPCDAVHGLIEDETKSFWLYMGCGLVRIQRSELDAWFLDRNRRIKTTLFDLLDGVKSHAGTFNYAPRMASGKDGKVWFVPFDGVSYVDPGHLSSNPLPPPVRVEEVTANGITYDPAANGQLHLPPNIRDLSVRYTALSFVAPEKVRFRIKLEGQDTDWRELTDRHVQYTNLAPRSYRFRVLACNNSGVWNEGGATLGFSVDPAFYQANWFLALCVLLLLAMLWAAWQWRVRQLRHQFEMTLDARVGERTRIAREIHDTLLQTFQGVLLRLQIVSQLIRERPNEAQQSLDNTMELAAQAITEGRDAVQGLRDSTVQSNDLARAVNALGEDLATAPASHGSPLFRVTVEGESRELHPILRDEIYRIAAEALRNAFSHARARKIEVEIRYHDDQFRLRVRDDGRGIDPAVLLPQGRQGHYGLPGMRERAAEIGGKLAVWSELDAGTEVELTVPAARAYRENGLRSWFSRRLTSKHQ